MTTAPRHGPCPCTFISSRASRRDPGGSFHRSFRDQSRVRKIVSESHLSGTCPTLGEAGPPAIDHHRNRAATSEFQVPVHIAIGYHELAVPLTTVPAPTGNLTLITPRLIIGSARFRSCFHASSDPTPSHSLLFVHPKKRQEEKEEECGMEM